METWGIHSASRSTRILCSICSRGSGIARSAIRVKMHDSRLCERDLGWRVVGSIDSTLENGVDATVDRATCLRTLAVLHGVVEVLFHSQGKIAVKGSGTQL